MDTVTITAADDRTFRIEAPDGDLAWGGLGPDSLALGRVSIGPVCEVEDEPGVFTMTVSSEVGVYVCDVPHTTYVYPFDAVYEAPHTCLVDDLSAPEQLEALRAGVAECLDYAARHPGLDLQLRATARREREKGRGTWLAGLVEQHLQSLESCSVAPNGEPVRVPTERLADAVERITGDRPRNEMQARTLMRRWARRRGVRRRK